MGLFICKNGFLPSFESFQSFRMSSCIRCLRYDLNSHIEDLLFADVLYTFISTDGIRCCCAAAIHTNTVYRNHFLISNTLIPLEKLTQKQKLKLENIKAVAIQRQTVNGLVLMGILRSNKKLT